MMTARDRVDASLATPNLVARASSAFGLLALSLAAVGLSGLVALHDDAAHQGDRDSDRSGADQRNVRQLVLIDTSRLVALGAALGPPAALALAQLLSGLLYQVGPYEPLVVSLSLRRARRRLGTGRLPAGSASRTGQSNRGAAVRVAGQD